MVTNLLELGQNSGMQNNLIWYRIRWLFLLWRVSLFLSSKVSTQSTYIYSSFKNTITSVAEKKLGRTNTRNSKCKISSASISTYACWSFQLRKQYESTLSVTCPWNFLFNILPQHQDCKGNPWGRRENPGKIGVPGHCNFYELYGGLPWLHFPGFTTVILH